MTAPHQITFDFSAKNTATMRDSADASTVDVAARPTAAAPEAVEVAPAAITAPVDASTPPVLTTGTVSLETTPRAGRSVVPATLAAALAQIEADPGLAAVRRRDLASALRQAAKILGEPLDVIPADLRALATRLERLEPARLGKSPKTLANLRTNIIAALRQCGVRRGRVRVQLTPAWNTLYALLPDKHSRDSMIGFMRYCVAAGLAPDAVSDGTVTAYRAHLEAETLFPGAKVKAIVRQTCRIWNRMRASADSWPAQTLTVPDHRKPRTSLPLAAFPAAFRADVDGYFAWLAVDDPFTDDGPPRVCKPSTIAQRRRMIELAASVLVHRGVPPAQITALACLVELAHAKEILRFYYEKQGRKWTTFSRGLLKLLVSIARHWVEVDGARLAGLRALRPTKDKEPVGLTAKNTAMLRQFYDPLNVRKLYLLPQHLAGLARRNCLSPARQAVLMQTAVAIEILLHAPIRMGNLIALETGRSLVKPAGSRGLFYVVLNADETKNSQPLEYELARATTDFVDAYLRDYHPILVPGGTAHLFPALRRGRKSQSTLAQQIVETIRTQTGLVMTPHQFRHLAAALILDEHPGALQLVQRLLGHKSLKTTITFYAGINPRAASRLMGELAAKRRGPGGTRGTAR